MVTFLVHFFRRLKDALGRFVWWSVNLQQTLTGFFCAFSSPIIEQLNFFNPWKAK
jgi:hypothetical protein